MTQPLLTPQQLSDASVSNPGKSLGYSIYEIPGSRLIFRVHEQPKTLRANWGIK